MAANTVISGCNGSAVIGSRGCRFSAWSADLVHEIYDATGYSSAGYRQNVGGLKSCSGSASGWLTKGSTSDTPNFTALTCGDAGVTMTLTADTSCSYVFTANVSNMRIDHSVADTARITFNFISNGTITENWVTA